MFSPVDGSVKFPELEREIGRFWKEHGIYEKSLAQREGAPPFVFYEGPPTANGMPHPGHCLTRAIKDLFPRYRTMRGYRCERKAGWDTHGLPVEVEVCKELGIHTKEEIEQYGVERFIAKCQQSVWRYMQEWERLTERLGFWIHLDEAYVTYHQSYVESVWWSLKNLFDRGLLYQGHKIVWWWAQGGTALSAGEVGLGYREVADPSVYVKFPIVADEKAKKLGIDENTSLLVWTTTPWTLPSNQFAAVHPDLDYAIVTAQLAADESSRASDTTEKLIITSALVNSIEEKIKGKFNVVRKVKGRELIGCRYCPPFECYSRHPDVHKRWGDWHDPYEELSPGTNIDQHAKDREAKHRVELKSRGNCDWLRAWRIVEGVFVTLDAGTGAVHIAPAFGDVDFSVLQEIQEQNRAGSYKPQLINAVAPNGTFTNEAPEYLRGRWVKDCDKDIIRDLKQRGLLYHQEQYVHDYPFCWRAEQDPLIQYPRESWFIRTTAFKEEMLKNNAEINWLPEHIKTGRFGKFLETNVDWALSRERYWGTPLPIWKCSETGQMEAVANYDELLAKPGIRGTEIWDEAKRANPELPDDLRVHKPYIDAVTYDSSFAKGARMERVPEVIDCWYDSGAMPFAQWGYPNKPGSDGQFESQFPADFISEAIDQTRGWFYSQLAISTLLFGEQPSGQSAIRNPQSAIARYPHPFKNCIVLGLMLGEDGQKMSKSKRNYLPPNEIFDKYGADALRWYFFANQPPWTSIRYSEQAIKDSIPEFLLRLWNVYSFFVIYANIDGFDPSKESPLERGSTWPSKFVPAPQFKLAKTYRKVSERVEIDRWILSELNRACIGVVECMDAYNNYGACQNIIEFVDALSNWYVRRSRDRFWMADKRAQEKLDAYWTVYECLLTICELIAPFTPFISEAIWRNLVGVYGDSAPESVHLLDYPKGDPSLIDEELSAQFRFIREVVSLGRNARTVAGMKVRQPLAEIHVTVSDAKKQGWIVTHSQLIREELNVKAISISTEDDEEKYVTYSFSPNFKRLGPRVGKNMSVIKQVLTEVAGERLKGLLAQRSQYGEVRLDLPNGEHVVLDNEDIEVRLQAKEGWAAAQGKGCVVVLATELTPELIAEGLARDLVRVIQDRRKEMGCEFTDRIEVGIVTESAELREAIERYQDYIMAETLAVQLVFEPLPGVEPLRTEISGHAIEIFIRVVQ